MHLKQNDELAIASSDLGGLSNCVRLTGGTREWLTAHGKVRRADVNVK